MENVTPSIEPVTEGQIGKFNQNVTARLLKHKAEIPSNLFQQILGDTTLIDEVHAAIRKRIDAMSNMITRVVSVNRKRYAQQALDATGRKQYVNSDVVIAMPSGEGEEAEVIFFKLGKYVSDANLDKEYDLRGLKPADPYSLAAVNEADPAFADEHPNCTHWKDAKGKWCFAAFRHGDGDERGVSVRRSGGGWVGGWWFAGVRK